MQARLLRAVVSRLLLSVPLLGGPAFALAPSVTWAPTPPPLTIRSVGPASPAGSTLVNVDRADDGIFTACTPADDDCTLRGAITYVNGAAGIFTIRFDNDIAEITLTTPLPAITRAETWVLGEAGVPFLNAAGLANGDVMTINGNFIRIAELTIGNGVESGLYADIRVQGGQGTRIEDNVLGITALTGAATRAANGAPGVVDGAKCASNSMHGIVITATAGTVLNGLGTYINGNTIGCHPGHGVYGNGADYVYVGQTDEGELIANYIGVAPSGAWLPNGQDGVAFDALGNDGASQNQITNNFIAGNGGHGVSLTGPITTGVGGELTWANVVSGNRIGLDTVGNLGNMGDGVHLSGLTYINMIGGPNAADRNVISANQGHGVAIFDGDSNGILGNYIGTNLDGSDGNFGNEGSGIYLAGGTANLVGGFQDEFASFVAPNVIANNAENGVTAVGSPIRASPAGFDFSGYSVLIYANYIGTNPAGSLGLGNSGAGINLTNISNGSVVSNVVSGNAGNGIELFGSQAITLSSNYVGTNPAGTVTLANSGHGIALLSGSTDNSIGYEAEGGRNVISGNAGCGVSVGLSDSNRVMYNLIGLNAAGDEVLPNGADGVCLANSDLNWIGSGNPIWSQFISGNSGHGVRLGELAEGNIIFSNTSIGVESDDTSPAGNSQHGVLIEDSSNNDVEAGVVANNGGAGVVISGTTSANNTAYPGSVKNNGGLAIDLGHDGHTPNDPGDGDSGPNGLLNYPEITLVAGNTLTGTTCANCTVLFYDAAGDPAASGGGGEEVATAVTANGSGQWTIALPGGRTAADITMLAISPAGDSSELSPRGPSLVYLPLITK